MTPDISIIIPHLNQKDMLRKCVASILAQRVPGKTIEIIVADNGTRGGIEDIGELSPLIRVITVNQRGAAHARNAALDMVRGRFIAFLDADCIAEQDWLREGLSCLQRADISGGEVRIAVANSSVPRPVESFERVFAFNQRKYVEKLNFSVTANIITSREVVEAVGKFRNGVPEDVDWCNRAVALGFRLAFNDKSIVSHPARVDFETLVLKWDRLLKEKREMIGEIRSKPRITFSLLALATAGSIVPHLVVIALTRRLSTISERIGAGVVLIRIRLWRSWRLFQFAFDPKPE